MASPDSELAVRFRQRARRALIAAVAALNASTGLQKRALAKLGTEVIHEALSVAVLRFVVLSVGRARGLFVAPADWQHGRLFLARVPALEVRAALQDGKLCWIFPELLAPAQGAFQAELELGLASDGIDFSACPAELVGNLYELLLAESVQRGPDGQLSLSSGNKRKQTGTFFTPRALTEVVVGRALEPLLRLIEGSPERRQSLVLDFRACDPTVGGGAFLVELARNLARSSGATSAEGRSAIVNRALFGVDIDPIAVAVAEAALYLFAEDPALSLAEAGRNLRVGDALVGAPYAVSERRPPQQHPDLPVAFDFPAQYPEVFERGGFDLVIGNPPWVAYAGRAAQPLPLARKAYLASHYTTLKGYPTLHGLFVERALGLAPHGSVALVVPSPIADLQGYRAVRRAVRKRHVPSEPMLEFGQDAFESVTQPCFALIAEAARGSRSAEAATDAPFRLAERQRAGAPAAELAAPAALSEIAKLPPFPRELFGEMGFQTTKRVSQELLLRAPAANDRHHYPLLEGRNVRAFWQGEPKLFLAPDSQVLAASRCRLRDPGDYGRVRFVVRQTARYPIAAIHSGLSFRNSLLAGFAVEGLPPDLVVGLLNSSLYRALHLSSQRDARQATFPQVKIAHLRGLPAPPPDPAGREKIASLSAELTRRGVEPELAGRLDAAVYELFSLESAAAREIHDFLGARTGPRGESDR